MATCFEYYQTTDTSNWTYGYNSGWNYEFKVVEDDGWNPPDNERY